MYRYVGIMLKKRDDDFLKKLIEPKAIVCYISSRTAPPPRVCPDYRSRWIIQSPQFQLRVTEVCIDLDESSIRCSAEALYSYRRTHIYMNMVRVQVSTGEVEMDTSVFGGGLTTNM